MESQHAEIIIGLLQRQTALLEELAIRASESIEITRQIHAAWLKDQRQQVITASAKRAADLAFKRMVDTFAEEPA